METKFQTSFIPKKPLISDQKPHVRVGVSIFMSIAVIIFIASLAGAGFTYAWRSLLTDRQETYKKDLADQEKRFDTATIERLKKKNIKINFAKEILKNHLSTTEIFDIIAGLTIDGVRFSSLDYSGPDPKTQSDSNLAKISMKGIANSFSSIAWQSDVFGRSDKYGTNKILKNPVLSDLSVDTTGNVSFSFSAYVDPQDISYEKALKAILPPAESPSVPEATSTQP